LAGGSRFPFMSLFFFLSLSICPLVFSVSVETFKLLPSLDSFFIRMFFPSASMPFLVVFFWARSKDALGGGLAVYPDYKPEFHEGIIQ